MAQQQDSLQQA